MKWLLIVLIVLTVVIIGSIISQRGVKTWLFDSSQTIISPQQPPSIVFGIVWTILYLIYLAVWLTATKNEPWNSIDTLFAIGMVLNLAWVWTFFGRRDMLWSRIIIILMIGVGLVQAYMVWQVNTLPAVLTFGILIYVAWLIVATGLNFGTTFITT